MIFRYENLVIGQIEYLYALIPLAIMLFVLLRKKYIKEDQRMFNKPGKKRFTFFFTLVIFALVLIALANPYLEYKENTSNISKIKVLIDESYSTALYDLPDIEYTLNSLNQKGISMQVEKLNMEDYSSLGNAVLNNLAPGENVLLVSDGQNNFGPSLEDVSLFASSINSKIYGIKLEQQKSDASVSIEGPAKVVSGVENTFKVIVNEVGSAGKKEVKIYVDDELAAKEIYTKPIEIKKTFTSGAHTISASLATDPAKDIFPQNNEFYKVVTVYKKPLVLLVTKKDSPLKGFYSPFYDLQVDSVLPSDFQKYYSVILDDMNAADLSYTDIESLENYVSDGNGLFVVGGKNSYDWGDYNTSLLLNLLPVNVGKANKKKDVVNIAVIWDTGLSLGAETTCNEDKTKCVTQNITNEEQVASADTIRSIVLSVLKAIPDTSKVTLIESALFSVPGENAARTSTLSELSDIGPKRAELMKEVTTLKFTGISRYSEPFKLAHDKLKLTKGTKLILLISDGIGNGPADRATLEKLVPLAYNDGIKTHTYYFGGFGNPDFMKEIAELGGGQYNTIGKDNSIKLHFGDSTQEQGNDLSIFVYDSNHFITKDLDNLGVVYGYNNVYPKPTARLLLTSFSGDPLLTIWNYGLGRVASLSTDDGSSWVPDLLSNQNSKLLIRTLNWLVEDPERKNDFIMEVPELRLGESNPITFRSAKIPDSSEQIFYEVDKNLFRTNYFPNQTGFSQILGLPVAVNYKKEYLNLGINSDFEKVLKISGGELLENDADAISQKLLAVSEVSTIRKVNLAWLFIVAALILYLTEIVIRRLYELRLQQ